MQWQLSNRRLFGRLTIYSLIVSLVAITTTQVIGSLTTTSLAILHHEAENLVYVVYVRDMAHNLRLWLAGTRCFKPFPPWLTRNRQHYLQHVPEIGQRVVWVSNQINDIADRLRCP